MAESVPVYQWTDSNGAVHYTDQPKSGYQPIPLRDNTLVFIKTGGTSSKSGKAAASSDDQVKKDNEAKKPYTTFVIRSPRNGQAIPNPVTVDVDLVIKPALQGDDKIQLYVDGKLYHQDGATTHFSLGQALMPRGEHTVRAEIVDAQGTVLRSTDIITFTVNRVHLGEHILKIEG